MTKKTDTPTEGDNAPTGARALNSFVQRIERLSEEKKALAADIKLVFDEAKVTGFDAKVLREVIKRRAKDKADVEEFDALLATYETALDAILS